ncbi:MAG: DUF1566 domain-containing protein [Nitrospirae bacterium]|nr:DUF1566 domain-containing protein [Nitrospirota bacterium]
MTTSTGLPNFFGHNDWRLPEIKELAQLCNKEGSSANALGPYCNGSAFNAANWLKYQGFINVELLYWSSREVQSLGTQPDNAWCVLMSDGSISTCPKIRTLYVWPVR